MPVVQLATSHSSAAEAAPPRLMPVVALVAEQLTTRDDVAAKLERDGVASFQKSFDELLGALGAKADELRAEQKKLSAERKIDEAKANKEKIREAEEKGRKAKGKKKRTIGILEGGIERDATLAEIVADLARRARDCDEEIARRNLRWSLVVETLCLHGGLDPAILPALLRQQTKGAVYPAQRAILSAARAYVRWH